MSDLVSISAHDLARLRNAALRIQSSMASLRQQYAEWEELWNTIGKSIAPTSWETPPMETDERDDDEAINLMFKQMKEQPKAEETLDLSAKSMKKLEQAEVDTCNGSQQMNSPQSNVPLAKSPPQSRCSNRGLPKCTASLSSNQEALGAPEVDNFSEAIHSMIQQHRLSTLSNQIPKLVVQPEIVPETSAVTSGVIKAISIESVTASLTVAQAKRIQIKDDNDSEICLIRAPLPQRPKLPVAIKEEEVASNVVAIVFSDAAENHLPASSSAVPVETDRLASNSNNTGASAFQLAVHPNSAFSRPPSTAVTKPQSTSGDPPEPRLEAVDSAAKAQKIAEPFKSLSTSEATKWRVIRAKTTANVTARRVSRSDSPEQGATLPIDNFAKTSTSSLQFNKTSTNSLPNKRLCVRMSSQVKGPSLEADEEAMPAHNNLQTVKLRDPALDEATFSLPPRRECPNRPPFDLRSTLKRNRSESSSDEAPQEPLQVVVVANSTRHLVSSEPTQLASVSRHAKYTEIQLNCTWPNCQRCFDEANSLRAHLEAEHDGLMYHCAIEGCDQSFASRMDLLQHIAKHSGADTLKCSRCPQKPTFEDGSLLLWHQIEAHHRGIFSCTECAFKGSYRAEIIKHWNRKHDPKLKTDSIGSGGGGSQTSSGDRKYRTKSVNCLDCEVRFGTTEDLDQHRFVEHGIKKYPCPLILCDQSFAVQSELTKHCRQVHSKITSWKCFKCTWQYNSGFNLCNHMYLAHGEGCFSCTQCPYEAAYRGDVIEHFTRKHVTELKKEVEVVTSEVSCEENIERRVRCIKCVESFSEARDMVQHVTAKHGIELWRCPLERICHLTFRYRNVLVKHLSDRHSDTATEWQCRQCSTKFSDGANLSEHQLTVHNTAVARAIERSKQRRR